MPYYVGPDGRIYNRPVNDGTRTGGNVPPPPRNNTHYEPRPPVTAEAGFFRKALYWLTAGGGSISIARAMGEFLSTEIFADNSLDGIVGGVSGMLVTAAPILLYILAVIACLVLGIGAGEDHNYNLAGLIITVFGTAGICLIGAVALVFLPYAAALVGILLGIGIVIGIIASLFGG